MDWLEYFREGVFRGGCFFHTVKAEFDSRPESPVRDEVIADVREFYAFLAREIRKAQEAGDLDPEVDPDQLAFELDALGTAAHQQYQLLHDPAAFERAKAAIKGRLDALSTARRS